jgi:hypothetical protein
MLPALVPARVLAAAGRPGANDRIRVGLIGAGHRSWDLTKESPADLELVAVADCDRRAIDAYFAATRHVEGSIVAQNCSVYQDYRQMLPARSWTPSSWRPPRTRGYWPVWTPCRPVWTSLPKSR